jgi:hypothetical protein
VKHQYLDRLLHTSPTPTTAEIGGPEEHEAEPTQPLLEAESTTRLRGRLSIQ